MKKLYFAVIDSNIYRLPEQQCLAAGFLRR